MQPASLNTRREKGQIYNDFRWRGIRALPIPTLSVIGPLNMISPY